MAKLFGQLDLFVVYIFKFFFKLGQKSFFVILGPYVWLERCISELVQSVGNV